jgi:hypothetical protein
MITPQPPKPDPNTYWVVPGKLLAGEYPGAFDSEEARRRLRRFLRAGVRHFIDLTEAGELTRLPQLGPSGAIKPAGQACVRTHAECLANSLLKTVSSTRTHRRWSTMRLAERYVQTLSRNALSAPRQALGHNSKAVHRAYAKRALMNIPSMEDYERKAAGAAMEKAS